MERQSSNMSGTFSPRPSLDLTVVSGLLQRLYGLEATGIRELESFNDRNFEVTTDKPVVIGARNGMDEKRLNHFILKVYNSKDSIDGNRVELSVRTMDYLWKKGFCCPMPVTNLGGKLVQLERISCKYIESDEDGCDISLFMITLLTYLPGEQLVSIAPPPAEILRDVGRQLASFHLLLKGFTDYDHTNPSTSCSGEWSLEKLPGQRRLLALVDDVELRRDVEKVMDLFEEHVVPVIPTFRKGIIHGDIHDQNILVSERPTGSLEQSLCQQSNGYHGYAISGIIDFGEVAYTCLIFDIAIAMWGMMTMRADDHLASAGHIIEGYCSVEEIPVTEKNALYHLVLARFAQDIVLRLVSREKDPDNAYIMSEYGESCAQLKSLLSIPKHDADTRWKLF